MPEGITGISIDSRTLQPGDAFFAIKGETMDGHDFATAAVEGRRRRCWSSPKASCRRSAG